MPDDQPVPVPIQPRVDEHAGDLDSLVDLGLADPPPAPSAEPPPPPSVDL
jgi:hypothetical protein